MNLAYSWLQDYTKTTLTPEELGERFLLTSSVVDSITDWSTRFSGFVTGKVLSVHPHPNADRLRIANVSIGSTNRTIVCGAPNLEIGQIVVVALPGTSVQSLKGGTLTIEESEIRGIKSEGMLCAASEVGIALVHQDGILVLDPETRSGIPFTQAIGLDDSVLDLEITPNRSDLLSYIGLAREVAAFEKKSLNLPPLYISQEQEKFPSFPIQVHLDPQSHCVRYSAICLDEVTVAPSPLWLQVRLLLSGIRPINTVVDITNYVMLEYGLPLHAFNLDYLIPAKTLTMRRAEAGETISTLDTTKRILQPGDIIMSTDIEGPIDLVGIMGGLSSSITPETTRVYLHAVVVSGPSVRRTARAMGMRTEASGRYEKGIDPELTITALKRAVYLLQSIAGASVSSTILDMYPKSKTERPRIHLSFSGIQQVLGVHISAPEAKSILQKLGFQIPVLTKSSFEAVPPSWRKDVALPEDIIEELVRMWGFERMPLSLPVGPVKAPQPNNHYLQKKIIRHTLASVGLHETIHQSFASEADLNKIVWPLESAICLPEPRLSQETAYLLPTHLLPFLNSISSVNRNKTSLGLFEIGTIFGTLVAETETLSIFWRSDSNIESLYRKAKTDLTALTTALSGTVRFKSASQTSTYYEGGTVVDMLIDSTNVGQLGVIKSSLLTAFKLRSGKNVLFATLPLVPLFSVIGKRKSITPLSIFPAIERDLTVVVGEEVAVGDLFNAIHESKIDILTTVSLTTIYRGKPLAEHQKSFTFHFMYNDLTRTLSDEEVSSDQKRIEILLSNKFSL